MNPLEIVKYSIGTIILAGVVWLGWDYVHCKRDLAVLQAIIEASDARAQETKLEQEKNYETVKSESDRRAADIARYRRLLLSTNKDKTSRDANIPKILSESTPPTDAAGIGCSIEYRSQCLEVINRAETCKDLIILNKFPIK